MAKLNTNNTGLSKVQGLGDRLPNLRNPLKFLGNSHEDGKTGSKVSGKSSRLPAFMFNFSLESATK
ncbi:hypothetical protein [Sorangium sp. So ce590]|uniref:hypothetical protein n=1 Tax=unclassified Sorangium TaxID=2621164 RepID=UPI003F5F6503